MQELLLSIIALMIFYDLSIHLVYLFRKDKFLLKSKFIWWPNWQKWGEKEQHQYQVFWSTFWAVALVLTMFLIVYE